MSRSSDDIEPIWPEHVRSIERLWEKLHKLRNSGHLSWKDILLLDAIKGVYFILLHSDEDHEARVKQETGRRSAGGTITGQTRKAKADEKLRAVLAIATTISKSSKAPLSLTNIALRTQTRLKAAKPAIELSERTIRGYLSKNKNSWQ